MVGRDEWLTVDEAAARLKVHPETLRRWLRAGLLPATKLNNRAGYRIRASVVERFLAGERFGEDEGKAAA